jgi:tRNA dimethylallyltransferase
VSAPGRGRPRVLALFGPTAAGKSALAHVAALALGGEVVVADPFQRYRGLEIAADAPRPHEHAAVPYHLVGDLDLAESSTAAGFARRATAVVDDVLRRGRVPIVAGGTGLYLRAALADLEFPPPADPVLRDEVERLVASDPAAAAEELRRRDAGLAASTDLANPRRLARALELARLGARRGDRLFEAPDRHPTLLVAATRPREVLDARIEARVHRELEEGLVAEIERALARPDLSREAAQVIGMREVEAVRSGDLTPDDLPAALAARTRRLARRQLAWLRRMPEAVVLDLGARAAEAGAAHLLRLWRESGR